MMIVYPRISTDGQIQPLKDAGCEKLFAETASGTRANRRELGRCIASLKAGDAAEAQKAGIACGPFQETKYAAEQGRVGVDALADGLKELQLRPDEFIVTGKGSRQEAFRRPG